MLEPSSSTDEQAQIAQLQAEIAAVRNAKPAGRSISSAIGSFL